MTSEKWFQQNYPEWVGCSDDEDMREARHSAMEEIKAALFRRDGGLTHCLRVRLIEFLGKRGVDEMAFRRDYYGYKERTDEFLMELAIVHLARHIITGRKKEFHILRSWAVCDSIRVYADNEDDARNKARSIYRPASDNYGGSDQVNVEIGHVAT